MACDADRARLVVGRSSTESMRVGSGRFTVDCQVPQPQRHLENVFSIVVSNTHDYLHNHGFLLAESGWELSPAYDINPNPQGHGLSLNITDTDNSLDFELVLEVAPFFRIGNPEAKKILDKVNSTVARWRRYATGAGIGHAEQEEMEPAFRAY